MNDKNEALCYVETSGDTVVKFRTIMRLRPDVTDEEVISLVEELKIVWSPGFLSKCRAEARKKPEGFAPDSVLQKARAEARLKDLQQ